MTQQNYNHRLVCHDLKGAWTLTNRRIAFGLFEAYTNAQVSYIVGLQKMVVTCSQNSFLSSLYLYRS